MKMVVIESPYAATDHDSVKDNIRFARAVCKYALSQGYAPYASHLFFTQPGLLDDNDPEERSLGINAGLAIGEHADEVWFCVRDEGEPYSKGMMLGYHHLQVHPSKRPIIKHLVFKFRLGHHPTAELVKDRSDLAEAFLEANRIGQ